MWINLQNTLSLEHRIIHSRKGMLHGQGWPLSISHKTYGTGFQTGRDFNLSHLVCQSFLNILNKVIIGLGQLLSFLLNLLGLSIIQIKVTTADGLEFLVSIGTNSFNSEFIHRIKEIENLKSLFLQKLHLRQLFNGCLIGTSSIINLLLAFWHTLNIFLQGNILAIL